jgi:hypothetical protein
MYSWGEQNVCDENESIKYSLYIMDVKFKDFIEKFGDIRGALAIISKINFQEELFNLEHALKHLVNITHLFKPHDMVRCQ